VSLPHAVLPPFLLLLLPGLPAGAQAPPLPPRHTGHLYISGYASDNVGEYLPDGTLVRTFQAPGMRQPRGVAVDPYGNVAVVGQGSAAIHLFTPDGQLLRTVTHPDLVSGTGLARDGQGRWFVANFSPGGILVFDADWQHLSTIREPGLDTVNCVAFEADGSFSVSNAAAAQVHLFDAAWNQVGVVAHPSLGSPMSIALDAAGNHYVSNGSRGTISKFGPGWRHLLDFGAGIVAAPQGIAVDADGVLTVTSYAAATVYRFDATGALLGSFPLTGVTTGRNAAWQVAPWFLARQGGVDTGRSEPQPVLRLNGSRGDVTGWLQLGAADPATLTLDAPPAGPVPAPCVVWAWSGAAGPDAVTGLPGGGLLAFPPPFAGGAPATLVNSIGLPGLLGTGLLPPVQAPATVWDLPAGIGRTGTFVLQGLLADAGAPGGTGWSPTNALTVEVQ